MNELDDVLDLLPSARENLRQLKTFQGLKEADVSRLQSEIEASEREPERLD